MPLVVAGLVEPKSTNEAPKDTTERQTKDEPKTETKETKEAEKKIDGSKAPGMEGMSAEAIRKFEEAMELEYQKREGGA